VFKDFTLKFHDINLNSHDFNSTFEDFSVKLNDIRLNSHDFNCVFKDFVLKFNDFKLKSDNITLEFWDFYLKKLKVPELNNFIYPILVSCAQANASDDDQRETSTERRLHLRFSSHVET
jgi:hypothetical protein